MKLTGKCKEDFEKWFNKGSHDEEYNNHMGFKFERSHPSMQYGVLIDFFDSVGIYIDIKYISRPFYVGYNYQFRVNEIDYCVKEVIKIKTRQEARTKAIEKANEIYNG